MALAAGRLRHRITLQKLTAGTSPTGANSKQTYVDMVTLPANIEPLSVRDVLNAQSVGSKARLRCVIRYRNDIVSAMQVKYNGKTYKIDGDPLPDANSGKEYLTLVLASI